MDDLSVREVNGYRAIIVPIYRWSGGVGECGECGEGSLISERGLTFQAGIDNASFAGYVEHEEIARRVLKCVGESGANVEYVRKLDDALCKLGMKDAHVSDIVARIDRMDGDQ